MTKHPGFGVMLTRLLDHRELSGQELADRAGVTANEVREVLTGRTPSEGLLRRIAPALGFHAVDLFVLAGLEVPDDMAPLDAAAERWAPYIVTDALHLPVPQRRELLQLILSLPQEARLSVFAARRLAPLADPGGRVIRMLQYRNLGWTGMAKLLAVVTPTYLSASTYGAIGFGRKELTPRLVTDFAALLGINARDLAALTGVRPRELPPPPPPEAADAAVLLWEARRLSAAQARHVAELARSLRGESRGYFVNLPGS
ncbi:helix-turn-helix domain-containing protein [Streptomyces sp. NPDC002763]|uniref:helix-turn-helix domain-containing protein n=1 Tax=Streptomyces sp. NPDC002763 TaxID=3154427 RepID=UPI003328F2A1